MKIGFTAGAYDLGPHAGHIALFKEAKKHCDHLIVALHVNPNVERPGKNVPMPSLSQRFIALMHNKLVDGIVVYETEQELFELLCILTPDIRFLGEDYKRMDFTGRHLDIPIHFCKRWHNVSSSGTRKKIAEIEKGRPSQDSCRAVPGPTRRGGSRRKIR